MRITKCNQEKRKDGKRLFERIKKQAQGITLIALVVTIIVLLILAGVAISLTVGDNGLFRRAENSADTWQEASEREAIELAVAGMQIGSMQETGMTKTELENSLKEQFGDEASVEDNEDESFLVTIGENQYYLGEDGKIIDSSNMVEISTAEELKVFRDDVNSGNTYEGWYVYLANDITLDINEEWEPIGLYLMENSSPDDETNTPFSGIFDGKEHEINGIYINTTNKAQGLFGFIKKAKISNLIIGKENSISGGILTGGVIGYGYNSIITNVCNKSNINGNFDINSQVGGIAGLTNNGSIIKNSYNLGNISAVGNLIGGIVGYSSNTQVSGCYNAGKVGSDNNQFVGGIIGAIYKGNVKILNCYNTSNIIGNNAVGGILGAGIEDTDLLVINNCYNTGNITGQSRTNGIYGNSISRIIIESKNNYYLNNTINGINGDDQKGVEIKNDEEMKKLSVQLGRAFKEDTNNINNGYPILSWQ